MTETSLEWNEGQRFSLIETAHRNRVGMAFCYCATRWVADLWRLSIVERGVPGHFPITEDLFLGSEYEAINKAAELNLRSLGLSSREAATMVASSMVGQVEDRRRRS
jgi:hypothetical protein